ncbi:hypothetical protein [Cylindrospermopsis raciborskii]|uniref:hypothetical protein n=1 Tax=Cylindrospermopsis raciborskii TaxID=77022 RepID=UPI001C3159AF|nr:hypothetical protein [Cylindrospermopsis raciborskii]
MPIRDFAICGRGFRVWESRREFLKRAIAHRELSAIALLPPFIPGEKGVFNSIGFPQPP